MAGAHPRGFGSFTRVLGRYVREQKALPLHTAIHKMTGLPARNLGLDNNRGRIAVGAYADLVLFDANTVAERATIQTPHLVSVGIRKVWVNGEVVFEEGKTTGNYPGKVIRR